MLNKDLSQGLSDVLEFRRDDFAGVVNGIDVKEFDPATDKKIVKNFSEKAYKTGKKACKNDLLDFFHLPYKDMPTFGLVSRLTWQKGISLILQNAMHMLERGANIVILGSGESELEAGFQSLRDMHPDQVGIYIGYSDDIAHKIYAGSDFFLMPSLFEPCGIGQMIAQRYGTLPIVRETGGLVDTVHAEVDGFSFYSFDPNSMRGALDIAFYYYYDNKDGLDKMIKNALKLDRSWGESMNRYLGIYKDAMRK